MASWQAHLVAQLCKWTVKGPLVRSPTPETIRKIFNASRPKVPRGCNAKQELINGVSGEWMSADTVSQIGTMLYLHGGSRRLHCSRP